jgi:hypothetical protein
MWKVTPFQFRVRLYVSIPTFFAVVESKETCYILNYTIMFALLITYRLTHLHKSMFIWMFRMHVSGHISFGGLLCFRHQIVETSKILNISLTWIDIAVLLLCILQLLPVTCRKRYTILSRARGSVNNNNGFWIGWLDLLTPYTIN